MSNLVRPTCPHCDQHVTVVMQGVDMYWDTGAQCWRAEAEPNKIICTDCGPIPINYVEIPDNE